MTRWLRSTTNMVRSTTTGYARWRCQSEYPHGAAACSSSSSFCDVAGRECCRFAIDVLLAVTTPPVEWNAANLVTIRAPIVLLTGRLVAVGFTVALLHQIWYAGVGGWLDATFSLSAVVALHIVGEPKRVSLADVVSLGGASLTRFCARRARTIANRYTAASTPHRSSMITGQATGVSPMPPRSSGRRRMMPVINSGVPDAQR